MDIDRDPLIISASDYLNQYPLNGTSVKTAENLHIYILSDFFLLGHSGLPMSSNREIIKDRLINFKVENVLYKFSTEFDTQITMLKGKYFPLYGDWAEGFWHWIMENLPYVMIAEYAGYNGNYLIPPVSFARQSIELLGVHPDRIIEYHGGNFHVEILYLIQRINGTNLGAHPYLLELIRKTILDIVHPSGEEIHQRRIYISRNKLGPQRRIIVNEDELLDIIAPYGFETVYMEGMSLKEQIALMANARALITPHGAAMAHTLFMPPQSLILELFAPVYINPVMLPAIESLRHKYYLIPSYFNKIPPKYSSGLDIEAFTKLIEVTLRRELGEPTQTSFSD